MVAERMEKKKKIIERHGWERCVDGPLLKQGPKHI